jgi:hypothetical protein
MYHVNLPSDGYTSVLLSMKIAQLSDAYLPHPGSFRMSEAVRGSRVVQALAIATKRSDLMLLRPSGLRAGSNDLDLAEASRCGVGHRLRMATCARSATSHVVRFTRQHATSIQNGSSLRYC